jgi:hypothetical protein
LINMGEKNELVRELEGLIRKMDIPQRRKELAQKEDLRWLKRCLGDRNAQHTNFGRAMEILKELV